MSVVLTNTMILLDGYDISGFLNRVTLAVSAEGLDDTRFGHTTRVRKGGVKDATATIGGFGDPGDPGMEAIAFARIGQSGIPFMVSPTGVAGDVAYFYDALKVEMSTFGPYGQIMPYSGTVSVSDGQWPVRGTIAIGKTPLTASGSGPVQPLGALTAGQVLTCSVQVVAISPGAGITVTVVSDDAAGMASPTVRATGAALTANGAQLLTVAGPIADTFWRADYVITGTTPSVTAVITLGIGSAG